MRGRNCHAVPPRWRFRADVLLARIAHMRRTCEFVPWNCAWSEGRGDINIRFPTADGVPLRIVTPPVSEPDRVARQHRNRVVPRAVVPQTAVCGTQPALAEAARPRLVRPLPAVYPRDASRSTGGAGQAGRSVRI